MKKPGQRIRVPKFQGVYVRESTTKRFRGKADKCFDIAYKDGQGKLVWEKVGWLSEGYSPQMAADIRAKRVRAIRHGDELPQRRKREITFGEVWQKYDVWLETNKSRSRDDRGIYRRHLEPRFSKKPISQITLLELENMKAELLNSGLAPATVKHILVLIRQIINKALAWELWKGENPVKKIKLPKLSNMRERFLSPAEATRLLEELAKVSGKLHDIALLSLHTGMRAGEIFALRWGHIALANGIILIADTKDSAEGRGRKVYMTESVKKILERHTKTEPEALVFEARKGGKIDQISKAFPRVVNRLGLNEGITDPRQKVCFHTLRHTFASWLAQRGETLLTIKELLGHKTIAMTERYSHLIPDHKREAVKGIEETLKGKNGD
jgi:integrase